MTMRNRGAVFVVAAALMLASLPAQADDSGFGINLGLNMGDLSGEQVTRDTSFRYGLLVGAMMYAWMENFGIQLELNYVQKGTRYDVFVSDGLPDDGETKLKFNYIQMPLLALAGMSLDNDLRLFGELGVSFAFLTSAEIEIDYKSEPTHTDDLWETTAGFDMGFILGAGLQMSRAAIGLRYEWGFLTTDSQPIGGFVMNAERYNRSLTLLGSFRF